MIEIKNNIGFNDECVQKLSTIHYPVQIGLIDADLLDHGTRHPNLALLKISSYCKHLGHKVFLVQNYSEIKEDELFGEHPHCDLLILSRVFKFTKLPDFVLHMIDSHQIVYGGTGFFEVNGPNLPYPVEHVHPDYTLYNDYIEVQTGGDLGKKKRDWDDYLSYSIGFTTRGCIRHCGFCVNRELSRVLSWSPVAEFFDPSRSKIYLWDDNIMAAPPKIFKNVMDELIATGRLFQFRQGMDIRLMTDEKAELLNRVKYYGDYIFAFDHYRIPGDDNENLQVDQTLRGLEVWRRHSKKSTKLYVLVAYNSQDENDIEGAFWRIQKLMEYGCLPYIMRFEAYNNSEYKTLYTQLARWCNQPNFFKKMSFRQFCVRNEEFHQGITNSTGIYNTNIDKSLCKKPTKCACYQAMLEFENKFPDIANKYFDLRWENVNPYKK